MSDSGGPTVEDLMLILFCVGFAAGAGVLPYSRSEELVARLAQLPSGE